MLAGCCNVCGVDIDAIRTSLSRSGLWCGEATLESYGVTVRGLQATFWAAVTTELRDAGYKLTREVAPWAEHPPTLARFITEHPAGDWLIGTSNHIMSLRDGKLTDTDLNAGGRRPVREAYEVTTEITEG